MKPSGPLFLVCLLALPLLAAAEDDAAARDRSEDLLGAIDCSAKKTALFYDYLTSTASLKGSIKLRCAKGKETITPPDWLAAEVSSMTAQELAVAGGKTSAAKLWAEPLDVIRDYADLVRKTAPVKDGGLGLQQKFLAEGCREALLRLDRAVGALAKTGLSCSFAGRGDLVFAGYAGALADLDTLERLFDIGSTETFYERSAAVVKNAETAFSALFMETPPQTVCGKFTAEYFVAPRLYSGMRAVTLPFSAYQLEGVKRGDRVDLMVTYEYAATAGKDIITATIIQAAPVLAAVKPVDQSSTAKGSLTLLFTPVQAQYAALAMAQGRELSLALRAPGDTEPRGIEAASFKKIIK